MGLNRVISLGVYTVLAAAEGCGVNEAGGFNQKWYLFPTCGGELKLRLN